MGNHRNPEEIGSEMVEQLSKCGNKRSLVAAPRARTAVRLSAALRFPRLDLETPIHQAALAIRAHILSLEVANKEKRGPNRGQRDDVPRLY